jgi:hypothetical protein
VSEQMNLFDVVTTQYGVQVEPALCRRTDPETSQQAAAQVASNLNAKQAEFVAAARALRQATAAEVAAYAVPLEIGQTTAGLCKRETIRKRASELVKLGWIRVVGVRKCDITGNAASVYEVVK